MLKKQYLKTKPVCKVTFSLPKEAAPEADEILLMGDFNGWKRENGIPMKAGKKEYKATVELETGRNYEFRYLVDGHRWVNDWKADDYVSSPFHGIENSVVQIEETQVAAEAPAPRPKKAAAPKKAAKPAAKNPRKPAPKKKAAPAQKDDLKKIEGIGPKIAELLTRGGIESYEALSKAKGTMIKEILEKAGPRYKMHDPTTWKQQAKLAAKGEWEKLQKLQDELKGGRKKK